MQTKRILMTSVILAALVFSGCAAAGSTIDKESGTEEVQTEAVEESSNQEGSEDKQAEVGQTDGAEEADVAIETQAEGDSAIAGDASASESDQTNTEVAEAVPGLLTEEELKLYKPNELGEVMVVMYHGLGSKNSAYVRTPDAFRADLETYYEMGFRPVNLSDYVAGNINTPAGYTPIVLTFDDGNKSNFNIIEQDGVQVIDPDCAIGIMKAFSETHPDWELRGSFFVNGGIPFGQKELMEYKLNWLVENGLEVGNHSYGHEDLTELDAQGIQKTLGKNVRDIESVIEGWTVDTLALPFGKRPKDKALYDLVTAGEFDGTAYNHKAILLVGWKPEVSVYDKGFDPLAIMRVQSGDGDFQMIHWLEDYRKNPSKRFISDGNPETVTVPAGRADHIREDFKGSKEIVEYVIDEAVQ